MSTPAETAAPTVDANDTPYEIIERHEARAELLKVKGLVIEKECDTRRGWYFDYKFVTFRLSFLWLFPLIVLYGRRRLSLAIWPGGTASILSDLTSGAIRPGQASKSDSTYKISSRKKGKEPLPDRKLYTAHTLKEALAQLV